MSDDMIDRRLTGGAWLRLAPSVFALSSHPASFRQQCWAAVLGEHRSAIAGFSAATLLRLDDAPPRRIELAVPSTANARSSLAKVHRYSNVRVRRLDGLPVTTIAQTVFDIASRCKHDRMDRILDAVLLERRTTIDELDERLQAYEGTRRAGVALMRAALDDRRATGWQPNESELEHLLDQLTRGLPGAPVVARQHPFPWRDGAPGRVDRWIASYGVIVEADGRRWHARLHDFDRDRWRDNVALSHGVPVLRFTWTHLTQRMREARELVIATSGRSRVA